MYFQLVLFLAAEVYLIFIRFGLNALMVSKVMQKYMLKNKQKLLIQPLMFNLISRNTIL